MNKAENNLTTALDKHDVGYEYGTVRPYHHKYIDDSEKSFDAIFEAMENHSVDFFDWLIKQGRIKVYFPGEDAKKLYSQFNKEKEEQCSTS